MPLTLSVLVSVELAEIQSSCPTATNQRQNAPRMGFRWPGVQMKQRDREIPLGSFFTYGVLMLGLLCLGLIDTVAATAGETRSEFNHLKSDLGAVNLGREVSQTTKGPMTIVGRAVDSVRSETADGCRLGLAITNSVHSGNLHVLIDGQSVEGYDNVAWHSLVFSPNGKHFAFVANKDGKKICVRDGVAGHAYEQIGRYGTDSGRALSYSPDSLHLGYAARENGKWFVVLDDIPGPGFDSVDGMMLTRYEKKVFDGFTKWESKTWGGSDCPQFSADGRHVFYLGQRKDDQGNRFVLVLDGKLGPAYEAFWGAHLCPDGEVAYVGINGFDAQVVFDGVPEIAKGGSTLLFSRDGKHHAYIAGKAGSGSHSVVLNGKAGPQFKSIENLQFSPDGHVYYQTFLENSGWSLVRDEALVPPVDGYRVSRVYFSQDGQRITYVGEKGRDGRDMAFISDDKAVPFKSSNFLYFVSPDARRLVYETRIAEGRQLVVDGTPGPVIADYNNESLKFTGDSRRFAYVAHDANYRQSVVVDGQIGPLYFGIEKGHPIFDLTGNHYAYAARTGPSEWVVVLDGIPGPTLTNVDLPSLRFGPDGRLVYIAAIGTEQTVVINTTPGPRFSRIQPDSLTFSPDGKHFAYVAISVTTAKRSDMSPVQNLPVGVKNPEMKTLKKQVVFDGLPGPSCNGIGSKNVVFSSDSQHWAYSGQNNGHESVYIDGVPGPEFFAIEVGPLQRTDGQLEYLAYEGDYVSRKLVRVTVKGFAAVKP